jgi:hypothetical protein
VWLDWAVLNPLEHAADKSPSLVQTLTIHRTSAAVSPDACVRNSFHIISGITDIRTIVSSTAVDAEFPFH